MDMLLLLFLLSALEKDPSLKNALQNFLGFYRENRAFLTALLQQDAPAASPAAAGGAEAEKGAPAQKDKQKESRSETLGSLGLLDEYLKRCEI